jgi:Family of unknown function (DUF5331)
VDTEHLRASLKTLWLDYYRSNRIWINRLGIWVTCDGDRRPSSSFILATLAILEPKLHDILPLIVDLSSNPDRIVLALGLNFNPDSVLKERLEAENSLRMLPGAASSVKAIEGQAKTPQPATPPAADDFYPKDRRYQRRD